MVGAGFLMIGLALYALFMVMGKTLENRGLSLKIYLWAMALPFIANSFGWILAEIGRMPWIVYSLMTVDEGLSFTVPPAQMLITLLGFTLVYAALIVATIYLMAKYAKIVPAEQEDRISDSDDDAPALVPASD
jgi:cytochrome d ubiquinol oxidase subunit I